MAPGRTHLFFRKDNDFIILVIFVSDFAFAMNYICLLDALKYNLSSQFYVKLFCTRTSSLVETIQAILME